MGLISRVSSRTYRNSKMQIFLRGNHGETRTLEVLPTTTVGELQNQVPEGVRLLSNGLQLDEEDATLEDFGIQTESTIELVHPVLGGGRKRKKKVHMKPVVPVFLCLIIKTDITAVNVVSP